MPQAIQKRLTIGARVSLVAGFLLLGSAADSTAQARPTPPVGETNATVEGTMEKVYSALNIMIVTTVDGVKHTIHYTKTLLVHGGKEPTDALEGMEEGSTVVVHYTVSGADAVAQEVDRIGDQGLKKTEGRLANVDHGRGRVTITFFNGTQETFQLTRRAAGEVDATLAQAAKTGAEVIVYYTDEKGQKVAHFFKKVS